MVRYVANELALVRMQLSSLKQQRASLSLSLTSARLNAATRFILNAPKTYQFGGHKGKNFVQNALINRRGGQGSPALPEAALESALVKHLRQGQRLKRGLQFQNLNALVS